MNLEQALRDAAEPVRPRVAEPPAQALLDRIVAAPMESSVPVPADRRGTARRARRLAVAALAAAAVALGAVTLPMAGSGAAYASWSAQPSTLAAAERGELADRCVARVAEEYQYRETDRTARVVHAERRGDYAYLSVVTPGWSALCFRDHDGRLRNASILVDPVGAATLGGSGVDLQGWPQMRTAEGFCRLMAGHVGSRVVGVDVVVRSGSGAVTRTVRATVEDGYFLAWYPEPGDAASTDTTSLTLRLSGGGTVEGLSARSLMEAPHLN